MPSARNKSSGTRAQQGAATPLMEALQRLSEARPESLSADGLRQCREALSSDAANAQALAASIIAAYANTGDSERATLALQHGDMIEVLAALVCIPALAKFVRTSALVTYVAAALAALVRTRAQAVHAMSCGALESLAACLAQPEFSGSACDAATAISRLLAPFAPSHINGCPDFDLSSEVHRIAWAEANELPLSMSDGEWSTNAVAGAARVLRAGPADAPAVASVLRMLTLATLISEPLRQVLGSSDCVAELERLFRESRPGCDAALLLAPSVLLSVLAMEELLPEKAQADFTERYEEYKRGYIANLEGVPNFSFTTKTN
ncbi:hypothetical protein T492DRAFT_1104382 [Pavlovales sp. CCMP2436]|nr:hypothetical protein T492DRAFT_1104382 [Pavlovales sp. CCMP2436]